MSLPITLMQTGRVLVVGGGTVARRKIEWLVDGGVCAAELTVESPALCAELRACAGAFLHLPRAYESRSLAGFRLVFACTPEREINRLVAEDARASGALVNVADAPQECDFFVPATLRRGDLCVAFSAGGAPSLAAALRAEAEELYSPEFGDYARALASARTELAGLYPQAQERRAQVLRRLAGAQERRALLQCGAGPALGIRLLARARELLDAPEAPEA